MNQVAKQQATKESKVQSVYATLQALFPEEIKNQPDGSLKANLFQEIVARSIADVSGHINLPSQGASNDLKQDQRITIGRVFRSVKQALQTLGVGGSGKTLDFFLGNVSAYTKTIVQTPHPTEMLTVEAIKAEEKFLETLENNGNALFKKSSTHLPPSDLKAIKDSMDELFHALTSPTKLKISDEMRRSVIFSERIFDAVPLIADRVLHESGYQSHQLSDTQLKQLGHLVQPMTWSPGDQDSKPLMTVNELQRGFAINRRAMLKHYAVNLAEMYNEVRENSLVTEDDKHALKSIINNLLTTAQSYEEKKSKRSQNLEDYIRDTLQSEINQRDVDTKDTANDFKVMPQESIVEIANLSTPAKKYLSESELIADLGKLRKSSLNYNLHLNGSGSSSIGAIDALVIQAHNFGLNALKSQIRQNQDKHQDVFAHILKLLPDEMQNIHTPEELLTALNDTDAKAKIKNIITQELNNIEALGMIEPMQAETIEDKNKAYVYQTLKTLEFASEHPDFIPHYLIAECGGPDANGARSANDGKDDMLKVLALLSIMQPNDVAQPVEIVPLVEHPFQVTEDANGKIPYVEMMKAAFENEAFRAHHQRVSDVAYAHLLSHTTIEDGQVKNKSLTGTDVVASINPEFGHGESELKPNDNPITIAKLCMGAGSDVTKFGGVAAASMMQNAMFKLKEALAGLEHPVYVIDYIGCGGGVHRTQPVSNTAETVQGRSMRQTPDAIATKSTALLARSLRDRLTENGKNTESLLTGVARLIKTDSRNSLAQLNMGNLANLPRNPSSWNNFTKDLTQKASQNYQDFTATEMYQNMLSFTADQFCKMTSFAARPVNRIKQGASAHEEFPPAVGMEDLRAIGYGGALNASGSCASLYMGLGNIANIDTGQLAQYYKYDPLLQDTLNRAAYGVIMSDMKAAWQYVGADDVPNQTELNNLANSSPPADERRAQAKKALANITLEREAIGRKLVELHSQVAGKATPTFGDLGEQLLSVLPSEYASQLKFSRDNLKQPRQALAALFKNALENPSLLPDKNDPSYVKNATYTETIYPAMAAIFECFEHAPRALTSPNWGVQESMRNSGMQV